MRSVLVLNATYEPLQLVSPRRAIVLILAGRAEVVHENPDAEILHSPHLDIAVPTIVRLSHMVKVGQRRRTPPLTRRSILLRDGGRCAYCGGPADTIDHVIPRSRGGAHDWTNVVAACRRHNTEKGDRFLHEIGWRLPAAPRAPDGPWWRWRYVDIPDPSWEPYLPRAS
jgi:5-methylcytosine-specific restriction endonuclease McrA